MTEPVLPETDLDITGTAQRRAWYAKEFPPVEVVRPGILSIPTPVKLPIRYTLSYLLTGDDGAAVLVDPGWGSSDTLDALEAGLATVGKGIEQLSGVVITHVHPDHHGLTARLLERNPALWVAMHPDERGLLLSEDAHIEQYVGTYQEWMAGAGIPPSPALDDQATRLKNTILMPEPTMLLADGDVVPLPGRRIVAVATPGHTPGHLCLVDEDNGVILTGDHVLPRISPNVGGHADGMVSPLRSYLASLDRLADVDLEVLPAHEWRFRGLPARVAELKEHHRDRLDEVVVALDRAGAATAWQVAQSLTWAHGWEGLGEFQQRFAVGETIAHLVYLVEEGVVHADGSEPVRYRRA